MLTDGVHIYLILILYFKHNWMSCTKVTKILLIALVFRIKLFFLQNLMGRGAGTKFHTPSPLPVVGLQIVIVNLADYNAV
jgi:hypothetical protein